LISPLKEIKWDIGKDKINKNKLSVDVEFELFKGSYATSLLREFMKSDNITNY
jgi:tRNA(Glu) U13 pseudouridine synthase TruD